jgi:hypothetical protein
MEFPHFLVAESFAAARSAGCALAIEAAASWAFIFYSGPVLTQLLRALTIVVLYYFLADCQTHAGDADSLRQPYLHLHTFQHGFHCRRSNSDKTIARTQGLWCKASVKRIPTEIVVVDSIKQDP